MNQIQYFKHKNGSSFVAVSQEFSESVSFWHIGKSVCARIDLEQNLTSIPCSYYQNQENDYRPCNREEYLKARYSAQVATAEFFGEFQQFQTPSVDPDPSLMQGFMAQVRKPGPTVTLATGRVIKNDLPF